MLSGELMGVNALSGEIQKQVIAVGGGDAPIKTISVDGVEIEPDSKKNVNIDLSGKVDKPSLNTTQQVVTMKPNGETEGVNLASNSSIATFGAIPRYQNPAYDDADTPPNNMGNLVVADPTKPLHVTNKRYVDNNFLAKNTANDGLFRAYVKEGNGTNSLRTIQTVPQAATIPLRSGDGNVRTNTPVDGLDCANKNYVDDRFNGANKAVSFVNYSAMISSLNALESTTYSVGQNIMIVTLAVPDLWVSEIAETSVAYTYVSDDDFINELSTNGFVHVGYYKLSALETQKVDLTEYVKKTDYASTEKAGIVKINNYAGIRIDALNNTLYLDTANSTEIKNKSGTCALKVDQVDMGVLSGLAYSKLEWTEEEKASARALLGIDTLVGDINTALEAILGV